jgi:hypothetical protein
MFYTTSVSQNITWFNLENFRGSRELQVKNWCDNSNNMKYFVVTLKLRKGNIFLSLKEEKIIRERWFPGLTLKT